ncbi:immunoglobulin iota chain [Dasypus novemcinctus]|uniref:immunoglobulin iota chain n=1 Tax=Dasypus novemcinctus TaxID=9361 RepID=UPI0039C8D447
MSWTPVLLLLLTHCPGVAPQPVLNQLPSASAPLGTTVSLACTLSRDYSIGLHNIYWYQQRPGHPPRFLLRYFSHSDKSQGPNPEDEAMYYCAVGSSDREKGWEVGKRPAFPGTQAPRDTGTLD